MLIDGEKYACDACVRGHRVSNCQHADRPLNHINKKGRPVTQCPHCRSLRKSRASHVRCECGEKPHSKEDCPHLKTDRSDPSQKTHVCCCSHGQRCSCALKKESPLGSVPESTAPEVSCCGGGSGGGASTGASSVKPRLTNTHSDGNMTVFANGHHKPCHSKNHEASHQRGVPYQIPRPHSIHGHQPLTQRSMEQLPSSGNIDQGYNQFLDSLRVLQQEGRQSKSESTSPNPGLRQRSRTLNSGLQNLNMSTYSPFSLSNPGSPVPGLTEFGPNHNVMSGLDTALSMDDTFQALSASSIDPPHVDWSTYFNAPVHQRQLRVPESYTSAPTSVPLPLSGLDAPAPSSGAVSDAEDSAFATYAASNPAYAESNPGMSESASYAQSLPDQTRPNLYRINSATSFVHSGPTSTPHNPNFPDSVSSTGLVDTANLDVDSLLHGSTTTLSEIDRSSSGAGSPLGPGLLSTDGLHPQMGTIHGLTVENAQKMAHPTSATGRIDSNNANYPQKLASDTPPSPWAAIHDENLTAFDPREESIDTLWMT